MGEAADISVPVLHVNIPFEFARSDSCVFKKVKKK